MSRLRHLAKWELIDLATSIMLAAASTALAALILWCLVQIYIVEPGHEAAYRAAMEEARSCVSR